LEPELRPEVVATLPDALSIQCLPLFSMESLAFCRVGKY